MKEKESFFKATVAVLLTEVFPNPVGRDTNKEWVEICNQGGSRQQLSGWLLRAGTRSAKLPSFSIGPNSCRVVGKGQLHLALRNSNLFVSLVDAEGKVVSSIGYPGSIPEGMSVVQADGATVLSRHPTPGLFQLTIAAPRRSLPIPEGTDLARHPSLLSVLSLAVLVGLLLGIIAVMTIKRYDSVFHFFSTGDSAVGR